MYSVFAYVNVFVAYSSPALVVLTVDCGFLGSVCVIMKHFDLSDSLVRVMFILRLRFRWFSCVYYKCTELCVHLQLPVLASAMHALHSLSHAVSTRRIRALIG